MVLWRISIYRDLNGVGGLRLNGRWHTAGNPVVYMGDSPSGVLLEVCVHTAAANLPPSFTLLQIEGPDVEVTSIPVEILSADWLKQPELTRKMGTEWLRANTGVLLRVPSALVPYTSNYLFNPAHPLAGEFHIVEALEYPFDMRIKR